MAELRSAIPFFPVADVGATIRWYEEQLGFIGEPFSETEPYVFAIIYRDQIEIMLQRMEGYQKLTFTTSGQGGIWDAYIRIEGVKGSKISTNPYVSALQSYRSLYCAER
jgi:hypothetical protein